MVFVSGAMLVGLKRPFAGFFAETLFRPLLGIAGFAVAIAMSGGAAGINPILWVLSVGYAIVAVVQLVLLLRTVSEIPAGQGDPKPEVRRWWHFAVPWVALVVTAAGLVAAAVVGGAMADRGARASSTAEVMRVAE
jgi:hypothetical protein